MNPKNRWWIRGLIWGIGMFIMMELAWPYSHDEVITSKSLLSGAFIWGIGGLVFGWLVTLTEDKMNKGKKEA